MASLSSTQLFTEQIIMSDILGYHAGLQVAIAVLALLETVIFYVINNKQFRIGAKSASMLRNIPRKEGATLSSFVEYHSNTAAFLLEGHSKLGDIFAFKFRAVWVFDCYLTLRADYDN